MALVLNNYDKTNRKDRPKLTSYGRTVNNGFDVIFTDGFAEGANQ